MEEEEKPVKVKGVDTSKGDISDYRPSKYDPYSDYRPVKTPQEEFLKNLGSIGSIAPTRGFTQKTNFIVDPKAALLYTPVDLVKAIPNPVERAAALDDYGPKMVQLLDKDKYGIRFNDEIKDFARYHEKAYNKRVNQYLDDLDENQGVLESTVKTVGKLLGRTLTAIGGVIPTVYGMGSALFNWDSAKLFNNGAFDAWESMDRGIDEGTFVYGGSKYYQDENGTNRNFFSRIWTHPLKSINEDIAPAISFVAGAIATELLATAAAPFTGGASITANTARLGAQATRLGVQGVNLAAKGTNFITFGKSMRLLRGIDKLDDLGKAAKLEAYTEKWRKGIGTATSMVRSGAYESSLIARDTYDQTLQSLIDNHTKINGRGPSEAETALYKSKAEEASETAWFTNVPLVGFSNMIQFSKAFTGGYKINQALGRLNPLKGVSSVEGKAIANADKINKWSRKGIMFAGGLKSGITEGFEEYTQGVLQEGLSDYYTAKYTKGSMETSISFIDAMSKAARNYANSTEGQDSMSIGALMGLLGMRMPTIGVRYNAQTGKAEGIKYEGFKKFGGIREEIREMQKDINESRAVAQKINDGVSTNEVLAANFKNMATSLTIQSELDDYEAKGDLYNYKNKEHDLLHSFVTTRDKLGVADTILQDLDSFEKIPLKKFNEQFAVEGIQEFTEESRKESLGKTRKRVKDILQSTKEVEAVFNADKYFVDKIFNRKFSPFLGNEAAVEGLKDQMTYLHSVNKNLNERKAVLEDDIRKITNNKVDPTTADKLLATIVDATADGKAEIITNAKDRFKQIVNEWKAEDPIGYKTTAKQVIPLIKDLISIKSREAEVATMYNMLFTTKGAEKYMAVYEKLEEQYVENMTKLALEKVKETIEKSKTGSRADKGAADEKSLTGENTILDKKAKNELQEIEDILDKHTQEAIQNGVPIQDLSTLTGHISDTTSLEALRHKPAVFLKIKNILNEQDVYIGNSFEEFEELVAENPSLIPQVLGALEQLHQELKTEKSNKDPHLNFADPNDIAQANPKELSLEEQFAALMGPGTAEFIQGENVTSARIIPVVNDVVLKDGKPQYDTETGKYKKMDTDQPVDTAVINDPEFLNNATLENTPQYVEFRLAENEYGTGKDVNSSDYAETVAIDQYHNGVFLGRLPVFKAGMPSNFLALRQAIVAQQTKSSTTPAKASNLETKKADIERKTTKVISSEIVEKGNKKGQTRTVTQTNSIEDLEGTVLSVTEYDAKVGDTEVTLGGRTMTFKEFKEEFPLEEDWAEILNGFEDLNDDTKITVRKVRRTPTSSRFSSVVDIYSPILGKMTVEIKKDDAKYDAELAALSEASFSEEKVIIKNRVELKNVITDFDVEAQKLLNNPNPTIEEYDRVVGNYTFDLEADINDSLRADIESKLEDIRNTFTITSREESETERTKLVDENFDKIVEAFIKENKDFKKC